MRRAALILAAALLCVLVSAPSAFASFATMSDGRLTVTGAAGETNDLLITEHSGGGGDDDDGDSYIRVRESGPGADIFNGSGCVIYEGDAYCGSASRITVNAGDGDDRVVNQTSEPVTLSGGRGADQLFGGAGDDTIDGQEDSDTLSGGFGNDDLRGGSGSDTVTYSYAWYRIFADLDGNADDGAIGGHDNVRTDVENLTGGSSNDRLVGNAGPNALSGADGNDELYGAEGSDALHGGAGHDTLRGESGDDSLDSLDGVADSAHCGDGNDSLLADPADELVGDCEAVSFGVAPPPPAPAPQPVRMTKKLVRVTPAGLAPLRLRCTRAAPGRCTGKVTLTANRKRGAKASKRGARRQVVMGRGRFSVRRGRLATVEVRLSRNGRRRVIRRRRVRCKASVAVRQADGSVQTVTGTVTLLAPKAAGR